MYLKLTNGTASKYSLRQLREDNPTISFPKSIPDTLAASYDVYPYTFANEPSYDMFTQDLTEGSFTQDEDGNWTLGYTVQNKPQDDAERSIRMERDKRLFETDYLALSDNTLTSAMSTYRQALRDVTAQSGFPFSVVWPTKPSE